jgi:DNA polymerase III delta prime subunit
MASLSLARIHAPKTLADFTRDRGTTDAILDVAERARLNLLLSGDADSGKTSTLASLVNTLRIPTLLVDELTESGISFFRQDVRTFCRRARSAHRRLVAIDNIDTLSEQCQHVVRGLADSFSTKVQFIATARHPGRLVQGLSTRFCVVHLPRLNTSQMSSVLDTVATTSELAIPAPVRQILVRDCGSSIRAMFSALERVRILGHASGITSASAAADSATFTTIAEHLLAVDGLPAARATLQTLSDKGHGTADVLDGLFRSLHTIATLTDHQRYGAVALIAQYSGQAHQHPKPEHLNLMLLCELAHILRP